MVCYSRYKPTLKQVAAEKKKSPPKPKRPLQVSEEIHSLVSQLAQDRGLSMEQVVAKSVIKEAKAALNTPDDEKQRLYLSLAKNAEREINQRYMGEQSRRSVQMRCINDKRRKKSAAPATTSSFSHPPRPISPYSGYPVEYRYGFAVPKPPPSSYPTYSSPS